LGSGCPIDATRGFFDAKDSNTSMNAGQYLAGNPPQAPCSLASFLSRFHAIFTLNQDALIELHYNPSVGGPMNWGRLQIPGMRYLPTFRPSGTLHDKFAVMEPNPSDFTMPTSVQPYIKLHGSVNWIESTIGERVLIMVGQKSVSIGRFPILTWYHSV
jgi:hypothetical protein